VFIEVVKKLNLKSTLHSEAYRVSWLQNEHRITMREKCLINFDIGGYNDNILCNIFPMDVFHILLGRPWNFDRRVIHDGRRK